MPAALAVLFTRLVLALGLLLFSTLAIGECTFHGLKEGDEPEKKTIFGGCDYVSYSFKAGYSSDYSGFVGAGLILPLDQHDNWEGYFSDAGIIFSTSKYNDLSIYDLGFIKRGGWVFVSRGWEAGLSYATGNIDNFGVYAAYHYMWLVQVRAIKSEFKTQYSIELGLKF